MIRFMPRGLVVSAVHHFQLNVNISSPIRVLLLYFEELAI
jgi:hypothetical protein